MMVQSDLDLITAFSNTLSVKRKSERNDILLFYYHEVIIFLFVKKMKYNQRLQQETKFTRPYVRLRDFNARQLFLNFSLSQYRCLKLFFFKTYSKAILVINVFVFVTDYQKKSLVLQDFPLSKLWNKNCQSLHYLITNSNFASHHFFSLNKALLRNSSFKKGLKQVI